MKIESEGIMKKLMCPKCFCEDYSKKGWLKNKKENKKIRQYQCKSCKARFSVNSIKDTKWQKKPDLNEKIMVLYCEGNTLRGIARILQVGYHTVVRKWRFMAGKVRVKHLTTLEFGEIVTKYIQFDEMETFEHTRKKPLGIEVSIRPKNGQILSAKVCRIPIKALTIAKSEAVKYNKKTDRKEAFYKMIAETKQCLDEGYSVLSCDGNRESIRMAKIMCPKSLIETHVNDYAGMWRLNHTFAKLRHHLSRLKRKTWATTKAKEFLQMHLDLFIAYQNKYELF